MKLVSFHVAGRSSYGCLLSDGVHDLGARLGAVLPDLKAYLHAAALGLTRLGPESTTVDYRSNEIAYEPVIPHPGKIICVGLNYEEHRRETGRPQAEHPALFARFADTLIGHGHPIRRPAVSQALDYEGELALVIGSPSYRVSREQAAQVVAGYACCNDGTLRDWQRHTHQFMPGKNFPATCSLGPALVTCDEIRDLAPLAIETRLNGQVMQSAHLGDMIFAVPDLIAYISAFTPLAPGDVIATGTPGGVGFKREPPVFMKPGDRVEVRIEGIGRLSNEIEDEVPTAA
jgi:2-keto-4-pentenoate hydratase/2-oxohepta-3-ene-1,7-dioic acid hydratase in catechol pathway